jgi:molybdopterin-containing oxidoreductase family iron-sulfur binding subunit
VRDYWQRQHSGGDFEMWWRRALHDGIIRDTAFQTRTLTPRAEFPAQAVNQPARGFEVVFRPDPSVYDGRFANLGWLQELPKPLTKLTWDNVIYMSPRTAERMGLDRVVGSRGGEIWSEIVEFRFKGRSVRGPVYLVPGHPDDCVTVFFGYGRERAGRVGDKIGYNAFAVRTADAMWSGAGGEIVRTGQEYQLASTQLHFLMEGRDLVRATTLEEYLRDPETVHKRDHQPPQDLSLYPQYQYDGYRWGMAIDVSACIGCNACIVACQAENNIPVVGKEQVARSREMHWLRVDTYYEGAPENPTTYFQPIPCQQCEVAPCEVVCPVNATVHSAEGLNDMVYNRCVGTRYCSNNCPYKVRRFNYLLYQDWDTPTYKLMRNPEVTIRSRGVMEKCTYCVQRIQAAKIEAEKDGRRVRDGEILTACQAVCPTEAIIFGDLNDPSSRVAKLKAEKRNFALLGELNTRPRTSYLAALRNPNPELQGA